MSYRFVDSFRAGPGPARKLSTNSARHAAHTPQPETHTATILR